MPKNPYVFKFPLTYSEKIQIDHVLTFLDLFREQIKKIIETQKNNKSLYWAKGFYYLDPKIYTEKKEQDIDYSYLLNIDIIFRPPEQKENSKNPKDRYLVEVFDSNQTEDSGGFSEVFKVIKTIRLGSDFTLDKKKPFSSKKRVIKKQKIKKNSKDQKWKVKEDVSKYAVSQEMIKREEFLLKTYAKLGAKTVIESEVPETKEKFAFQIMKRAQGKTLHEFLNFSYSNDYFPDFQTRLMVLFTLLKEVNDLHYEKNIIHCDLKPTNIYVDYDKDNSSYTVTLIDFGGALSKKYKALGCSRQYTKFYCAPEQEFIENPNEKVDVYALGQMIKKDFFVDDLEEVLNALPPNLKQIYMSEYGGYVKIKNEKLSDSEEKQKKILKVLAENMTCENPKDRLSLNQILSLILDLNSILNHLVQGGSLGGNEKTADDLDLKIGQALIDYIMQTFTPDNVKKQDRAASVRRINDINRLLNQLYGESSQDKVSKTELERKVIVKDWAKSVRNRLGFFGTSALRSGVLTAVGLESNIVDQVDPAKACATIGLRPLLR